MKKILLMLTFICLLNATGVFSQQQMKIMTYNLLNYPGTDTSIRNPHFRTIMNATSPDILVVSEILSQTGVNGFLSKVLNSAGNVYSAGTFINGPDTDNAIFFKTAKFNFVSNKVIQTSLRNINEFKVTDKFFSDTLRIYAVHLKAGDTNYYQRAGEADSLRRITNLLAGGSDFIVVGDFNIYGSIEPSYQKLLADNPGDDGNFNDPFNMPGIWNSFSYRQYHTQSTRTRSFGDGATGGLDDRFDMILYSNGVENPGGIKFLPGTYVAYGNDGNHYNDSINEAPNAAVSQAIANALHYASDHLPVYAMFEFGNATYLNVKLIPEGIYDELSNRLLRRDTITIYLRNVSAPFAIVDSANAVLDSLSFNAVFTFRNAPSGNYYIMARHHNSIETWSKAGGIQYSIDSVMSYDFTNLSSQAFGNNLKQEGSKFCIYTGDENQDGIIDSEDLVSTYGDAVNFASGYLSTDMNGDYYTDASDITIVYNNSINFISKITP